MTLTNPTDDQLDAAFAGKVCGWKRIAEATNVAFEVPETGARGTPPAFTRSFDAVLPWLEKWRDSGNGIAIGATITSAGPGWRVDIIDVNGSTTITMFSLSLPMAIVGALLRAHGVEVEFTP